MARPDLNLLVTLEALLAEGSVAGAARRLRLSPSAMSRALARLRATPGDPLLVRAGRRLVPTPRALELRDEVGRLVDAAEAVPPPQAAPDPARLRRIFTPRPRGGLAETLRAAPIARVAREAPGVRLCFVPKPNRDSTPLRDGAVDLETGVVVKALGPEVRVQGLLRDRFVGVVRAGHDLATGEVTPARYAAVGHVGVSHGPVAQGHIDAIVDRALGALGLKREVAVMVGGFPAALGLARASDLVASVPERYTGALRAGMHSFPLPVPVPEIWLRGCVRDVCAAT